MALTTTVSVDLRANQTKALDQRVVTDPILMQLAATLADGTGLNAANKVFYDERTLTTGATEDLDLAGVLTDSFGTTLTFTKIRLIAIKADAANTTTITVGNGTNPFLLFGSGAHTIALDADSFFMVIKPSVAAMAVTAATGDILKMANAAGASATYRILVVGE